MAQVSMQLEKKAQKAGGDKYVGYFEGAEVSFYVPQNISRESGGVPYPNILVTIEPDLSK